MVAQIVEIDEVGQQIAQGIELHRIHLPQAHHSRVGEIQPHEGRDRLSTSQPSDTPGIAAWDGAGNWVQRRDAHPEGLQRIDGALALAFEEAVGEDRGVHAAGAGAAEAIDIDAAAR